MGRLTLTVGSTLVDRNGKKKTLLFYIAVLGLKTCSSTLAGLFHIGLPMANFILRQDAF